MARVIRREFSGLSTVPNRGKDVPIWHPLVHIGVEDDTAGVWKGTAHVFEM